MATPSSLPCQLSNALLGSRMRPDSFLLLAPAANLIRYRASNRRTHKNVSTTALSAALVLRRPHKRYR